jgi:hypothetical protein
MTRFQFGISGAPSMSSKNSSAAILMPRAKVSTAVSYCLSVGQRLSVMVVTVPSSFCRARLSCACSFCARDRESVAAGLAGVFLIFTHAENQPDLLAPGAGLEASPQYLFQFLSLVFAPHSLFLTNALIAHLKTKLCCLLSLLISTSNVPHRVDAEVVRA